MEQEARYAPLPFSIVHPPQLQRIATGVFPIDSVKLRHKTGRQCILVQVHEPLEAAGYIIESEPGIARVLGWNAVP